ncbi:MAG TPA: ABC transporter permease subunit [Firmicutes bacterium]|nr:ABC transporter permease subunit [Bacillota bacterium]
MRPTKAADQPVMLKPGLSGAGLHRKASWSTLLLLSPFLVLYAVFVLVPLLGLIVKSFSTANSLEFEIFRLPALLTTKWTLQNYVEVLGSAYYQQALVETVVISGAAVLLSTAAGIPLAYLVTRKDFRWRKVVRWVVSLPIYVPAVVTCYALLVFFGSYGLLNLALNSLFGFTLQIAFTRTAVILGTFALILPTYVRVVASAFQRVETSIEEASMSLGATEVGTFRRILLPLAVPDILAAVILTFTYSMGLVVVAMVIGGGARVRILPAEILDNIQSLGANIPKAAAMSVVLLVVALAGQFLSMLLLRSREAK